MGVSEEGVPNQEFLCICRSILSVKNQLRVSVSCSLGQSWRCCNGLKISGLRHLINGPPYQQSADKGDQHHDRCCRPGGLATSIRLVVYLVYTGDFKTGDFHGGEKAVGREVFRTH